MSRARIKRKPIPTTCDCGWEVPDVRRYSPGVALWIVECPACFRRTGKAATKIEAIRAWNGSRHAE